MCLIINCYVIQSILCEPPSELEDMINNLSDNQTDANNYYVSDYDEYEDDFEDYESDFEEDDEEEDEEMEEKESEDRNNANEYVAKQKYFTDVNVNSNAFKDSKESNVELNEEMVHKTHFLDFFVPNALKYFQTKNETNGHQNKMLKRGLELLEIIKLNKISANVCDIPPINYDVFIRIFGRKDTKQVKCQTCERNDIEIQTDSTINEHKWTQNPSITRNDCGNDFMEYNNISFHSAKVNPFSLSNFLTKAEPLMKTIIECEFGNENNSNNIPSGIE